MSNDDSDRLVLPIPWGHSCKKMWAHQRPAGWRSIMGSAMGVRCHGVPPDEIRPVVITIDEAGPYWAWWYAETHRHFPNEIHNVYPSQQLTEICFPYGTKSEERLGRGRLVRVRVELDEERAMGELR